MAEENEVKQEPKVAREVSSIGNTDLKSELDKLRSEVFDHLNYARGVERFRTVLVNLDTAIKDSDSEAAELTKRIDKRRNDQEVKSRTWDDNIWYQIAMLQDRLVERLLLPRSYQSWQIEFLTELLNKVSGVVEPTRKASEEIQHLKALQESYNNLYSQTRDSNKSVMEQMLAMNKQNVEEARSTMAAVLKAVMPQQAQTSDELTNLKAEMQALKEQKVKAEAAPEKAEESQSEEKEVLSRVNKRIFIKACELLAAGETAVMRALYQDFPPSDVNASKIVLNKYFVKHKTGQIKELSDAGRELQESLEERT